MREPVAPYQVGEKFRCVKQPVVDIGPELALGEPCGADIVIHKYWWCAQVCPVCLANYHVGGGGKMELSWTRRASTRPTRLAPFAPPSPATAASTYPNSNNPVEVSMSRLEAECQRCGETFNPDDENNLEHVERENGELCGGRGELMGEWFTVDEIGRYVEVALGLAAGTALDDFQADLLARAEAEAQRHGLPWPPAIDDDSNNTGGGLATDGAATLSAFVAVQSDDSAKDVLELVHRACGQVLCDIEPGDSLDVLVSVASNHVCRAMDEDDNDTEDGR